MKIILFSLFVFTGIFAKAQHQSAQATQVITMRLQPVSFIDFASIDNQRPPAQKADIAHEASTRGIILNRNLLQHAALPTPASSQKEETSSSRTVSFAFNENEPVYTFSSR